MALLTYFGLLLVAARANPYADKTLQARELVMRELGLSQDLPD